MPGRAEALRLLADDLTGALDSAAAFASLHVPVPVRWRGPIPEAGPVAWDSGTREASPVDARAAVAAVAARLMGGGRGLAFKKVDSLLRGNEADEIACLLQRLASRHCIIAPAFPAQGRITRDGRQHAWTGDAFSPVPADLSNALSFAGVPVVTLQPGDAVPPGVSLWNAQDDADLDAVVSAARDVPDVLWVGSAGLAAALARAARASAPMSATALARPILGLVGSDHEVTRAQLARVASLHLQIESATSDAIEAVRFRLQADRAVFVTVAMPGGMSRAQAAASIRACFTALLDGLARPATLVVTGGETLRSVCEALGADQLDVLGSILPGVPRARLRGGRWDTVDVVTKSGAFGTPELLERLLSGTIEPTAGAAA